MSDVNVFTHRPTRAQLSMAFIHPIVRKDEWDRIWAAARAQHWWQENLGLVGGDGHTFYFQRTGCATGFAAVEI